MNPHMIFVFPPGASYGGNYISSQFNIGLGSAYTISYLVKNGFNARPFLTDEPINVNECTAGILAQKPRVVGFTVYDANYCLCLLIADALRKANPDIIIIFGGPTPSVQAEIILKNKDSVDICVRREGEETCLELLILLEQVNFDLKRALEFFAEVKGITYRSGDQIIENPEREVLLASRGIPDFLDRYPSPYLSGILSSSKPGILTARGCNQHCVYCNCALMSRRIIATHSSERVVEELQYISRQFRHDNPTNVTIYDDAFTLIPQRALEICRRIIENRIKLPLVCITRCDTVDEELLETMKEAGFRSIGFSLESAVPRILRRIGKVQPPHTKNDDNFERENEFIEKFIKYTLYAKKIGIDYVFASIIVGLPGETQEEGQQTVDLIRSLGDNIDYYAHNFFKVYAGTPIFYNYEKYGITLLKYDNLIHFKTIHAYDTGKIRLSPKSNLEVDNIRIDKHNMKTLALLPSKKRSLNYFNKVILCTDKISRELILWLQSHLAINGPLIQIYSNVEQAKKYSTENEDALKKYISPTTFHMCYYQTLREEGVISLTPLRMHEFGHQCGLTIDMINTGVSLHSSSHPVNPLQSICIDRRREDTLCLHHILTHLSSRENVMNDLINAPIYPYISGLCAWETGPPNCRTLDTVIVDCENNLKTCWNGKPIGKVGMSFSRIIEKLKHYYQITEDKRGCRNCKKKDLCIKCIFPAFLSDDEYCNLKQNFNTEETATLIRGFDFFKEL